MPEEQQNEPPQKLETKVIYYVVSQTEYPTYEQPKYKRFLAKYDEKPESVGDGVVVKVAVTVYKDELNTDPCNLNAWTPEGKTWPGDDGGTNTIQDWLFYDSSLAKEYEGLGDDVYTGGFMKLDLTYFYHNQSNEYTGKGPLNDKSQTGNTPEFIPPTVPKDPSDQTSELILADPNTYTITWNGTGWDCTKKGQRNEVIGDLYITEKPNENPEEIEPGNLYVAGTLGKISNPTVNLTQTGPQGTRVASELNSTYLITVCRNPIQPSVSVSISGSSIIRPTAYYDYPLPVWSTGDGEWHNLTVSFRENQEISLSTTDTALKQELSVTIIKLDGNGTT